MEGRWEGGREGKGLHRCEGERRERRNGKPLFWFNRPAKSGVNTHVPLEATCMASSLEERRFKSRRGAGGGGGRGLEAAGVVQNKRVHVCGMVWREV